MTQNENEKAKNSPKLFKRLNKTLRNDLQSVADYCTPSDFLIYVLVCTAQATKSMKTNDIPLKSPIKLQQEMQKKFGIFQNLLDF